jgi:hypothetical protein
MSLFDSDTFIPKTKINKKKFKRKRKRKRREMDEKR